MTKCASFTKRHPILSAKTSDEFLLVFLAVQLFVVFLSLCVYVLRKLLNSVRCKNAHLVNKFRADRTQRYSSTVNANCWAFPFAASLAVFLVLSRHKVLLRNRVHHWKLWETGKHAVIVGLVPAVVLLSFWHAHNVFELAFWMGWWSLLIATAEGYVNDGSLLVGVDELVVVGLQHFWYQEVLVQT